MTTVNPKKKKPQTYLVVRVGLVLIAAAGVVAGVYTLAVVPPTESSFYPRCISHSLTGLNCPGCGTTRALHALLNGRLVQALAYNPLAFIILPAVGWSLFQSVQSWRYRRPFIAQSTAAKWFARALAIAVILFGVLRNLPWFPFTLLAPHEI